MNHDSVAALGYLEIGVADLEAWRHYSEYVLGVECHDAEGALHLRYDAACWRIRLVPSGEDDIRCAGFEAGSETRLERVRARLADAGYDVLEASADQAADRGVDRLLVCEDPFGLPIEIYAGDRRRPEPCSLEIVEGGFVTGEQGLGHIVLTGSDQAAGENFYMGGLGLRLSDHIELGPPEHELKLTFLHCNPRHHTLALIPVPGPKRLNHIMLQVTALDDVGHGLDRAKAAGVPIASALGRHTNDQMVSFYMQTPSGFDIEYGYGGVEIDDATWKPCTHHATSVWGHQRGGLQ